MKIGETIIEDTFAEGFAMRFSRVVVTAADEYWRDAAVRELSGYSSSVIACDAEVGVDRLLSNAETPDGRPGAAVLLFGFSTDKLKTALGTRIGQCVMTCPSTSVFDGYPNAEKTVPLGKHMRFFGDGYQKSKMIGEERFWRIPVMDGEFLVADVVGVGSGVAGGNIILQAVNKDLALKAARRGAEAVEQMPCIIAPFPGGVARSGSKVGSRYKALPASTAEAYCPTLRGRVDSKLHKDANCVYEIVVDGMDEEAVRKAMISAIKATVGEGVVAIGAGNYGGKLGKFHFHLHQLLSLD